jgi:hypothetical protein
MDETLVCALNQNCIPTRSYIMYYTQNLQAKFLNLGALIARQTIRVHPGLNFVNGNISALIESTGHPTTVLLTSPAVGTC